MPPSTDSIYNTPAISALTPDWQCEGRVPTSTDMSQNPDNGLRIVTIGGGTGQSTLLRGLKRLARDLTAIVPVSDDGGSSGRLREGFRMPPPGDARNCLVALADGDPLLSDLFNHRFDGDSSLNGHSLGNLLLAALYEQKGSFGESLAAAARLLDLSGRVVPVSDETGVVLMGRTVSGRLLSGESSVGKAPDPIEQVWIEPEETRAAARPRWRPLDWLSLSSSGPAASTPAFYPASWFAA